MVKAGLASLCLATAALAVHGQPPASTAGPRNVYTAGGEVRPKQPVRGDLVAAGGRVVVERPIGADATLAGGSVDVRAPVSEDLRIAGGAISIESKVGGDLFAAGADISLRPGSTVAGAAELNAANITVQGRIEGALRGRAQKIVVDGEVGGPTHLTAERIELGPKARLLGPLTYVSPAEISRAEGALVQGPVTREVAPGNASVRARQAPRGGGFSAPGAVLVYIALFAFSSAFVLLMPKFTNGAAVQLRAGPWAALGIGVASLLALPIVMLLLFVTILGIPLGLGLIGAYPVLLLAGFVVGVLCLTRLVRERLRKTASPEQAGARLGHFALGLLLVLLVGLVPVAGALFISLLALAGVGAGVLQLRSQRAGATRLASASELPPLPGHDVFPA
jgi:cytoskeletal protein CcmA (bactofilin family)